MVIMAVTIAEGVETVTAGVVETVIAEAVAVVKEGIAGIDRRGNNSKKN